MTNDIDNEFQKWTRNLFSFRNNFSSLKDHMNHRTKCIIMHSFDAYTKCRKWSGRNVRQSADNENKHEIRSQMFFILFCLKLPTHYIRDVAWSQYTTWKNLCSIIRRTINFALNSFECACQQQQKTLSCLADKRCLSQSILISADPNLSQVR